MGRVELQAFVHGPDKRSRAHGSATTCEYRPEYACLAETTCGPNGPGP
jgi:hypothetical protein